MLPRLPSSFACHQSLAGSLTGGGRDFPREQPWGDQVEAVAITRVVGRPIQAVGPQSPQTYQRPQGQFLRGRMLPENQFLGRSMGKEARLAERVLQPAGGGVSPAGCCLFELRREHVDGRVDVQPSRRQAMSRIPIREVVRPVGQDEIVGGADGDECEIGRAHV